MKNSTIAMIVEGIEYEPSIIESMDKFFFRKSTNSEYIKLVPLPADQNIYMLWQRFKKAGENADIIEVIRDSSDKTKEALQGYSRNDFSEVYMFMDLDKQQNNLPKKFNASEVVLEMLETFNNETENGKLYISYPMAESIGDYYKNMCLPINGKCLVNPYDKRYKEKVKNSEFYKEIETYTIDDWNNIIRIYMQRLSCLFGSKSILTKEHCKKITSFDIYQKQESNAENKIQVLSGFPEFIIDYFKKI